LISKPLVLSHGEPKSGVENFNLQPAQRYYNLQP
jgi:hypothetical protein